MLERAQKLVSGGHVHLLICLVVQALPCRTPVHPLLEFRRSKDLLNVRVPVCELGYALSLSHLYRDGLSLLECRVTLYLSVNRRLRVNKIVGLIDFLWLWHCLGLCGRLHKVIEHLSQLTDLIALTPHGLLGLHVHLGDLSGGLSPVLLG